MFVYYWNNLLKNNLILEWREGISERKMPLRKQDCRAKNASLLSYAVSLTKKI